MYQKLTPQEATVLLNKHTEAPFSGEYENFFLPGTFICRQCQSPLFDSKSKFDTHCGWPSFDSSFPNALMRKLDTDGQRTEILCAHCGGHLGHEFLGEGFTTANTRHCVNSLAIRFIAENEALPPVLDP